MTLVCPDPTTPPPITNELRAAWNAADLELGLDWSAYTPTLDLHHYNIYRADGFTVSPDTFGEVPTAAVADTPAASNWTGPAEGVLLFYDVRPADCLDRVPPE